MKKIIALALALSVLAVFLMIGCGTNTPSTPVIVATATVVPTATLVATSTAVTSPNVAGTITIPADSLDKQYKIIIDNDADYTNGTDVAGGIYTGVCGAGTVIEYAMQVAAGTYYLFAFVDKDSSGITVYDAGDYWGYYPATALPAAANLVVPGVGSVTADFALAEEFADLTISVTIPADQVGMSYRVGVYDSIEWGEVPASNIDSVCPAGTTFETVIAGVKEGNYYLMGMVDVNGNAGADFVPDEGDYLGIIGTTVALLDIPAAPNINVNNDMTINLAMETCNPNVSGTIYMPATATGKDYAVYFSTAPLGGGAGALGALLGTVTSGTTSQSFSLFVPIKCAYYLTGAVDNDGSGLSGGTPEGGDFFGIYGVATPITVWDPLPYPVEPNAALPGTGKNIYTSIVPDIGTIAGNIQLPAGQTQNGIVYQVLIDDDLDFANGVISMAVGTCGTSINVPYSVTVPAGTYFVYAVVKSASTAQYPPCAGDYVGAYGATWPAAPATPNVSVTSGNTTGGTNITLVLAANNVTGTLTLPANAEGKNLLVMLDDNGNGGDGGVSYLRVTQISGSSGTTLDYGALCLFAGNYYITAQIDVNSSGVPGDPEDDYAGQRGPDSLNATANTGLDIALNLINNLP